MDFVSEAFIFIYFSVKNYFFYRLIKISKSKSSSLIFSIIVALLTLFVNNLLTNNYQEHLDLSYVKGAIDLPPFLLLYIASDLVVSIILIIFNFYYNVPMFREKAFSIEIIRLFLLHVVFFSFVTHYWSVSFNAKYLNTDDLYICFRTRVQYDLASYYLENQKFPAQIGEATQFTTNPLNKSKLLIELFDEDQSLISVKDEMGNQILSSTDFLGMNLYYKEPARHDDYLRLLNYPIEAYCPNSKYTVR
jgi:hypothetical protein